MTLLSTLWSFWAAYRTALWCWILGYVNLPQLVTKSMWGYKNKHSPPPHTHLHITARMWAQACMCINGTHIVCHCNQECYFFNYSPPWVGWNLFTEACVICQEWGQNWCICSCSLLGSLAFPSVCHLKTAKAAPTTHNFLLSTYVLHNIWKSLCLYTHGSAHTRRVTA